MAALEWNTPEDFVPYKNLKGLMQHDPDDLKNSSKEEDRSAYKVYLDLCQMGVSQVFDKSWYGRVRRQQACFVKNYGPYDEAFLLIMYKEYAHKEFKKSIKQLQEENED